MKKDASNDGKRWDAIVAKAVTNSWDYELLTSMSRSDELAFFAAGNRPRDEVYGNVAISADSWHHVAMTRRDSTVTFFLDGTVTARAKMRKPFRISDHPLLIGYDGQSYMLGSIDEVRVYDHALDRSEVAALADTSMHKECSKGPTPFTADRLSGARVGATGDQAHNRGTAHPFQLLAKLPGWLKKRGLRQTVEQIRWLLYHTIHDRLAEKRHPSEAVSTAGYSSLEGLTTAGEACVDAIPYGPSPRLVLDWVHEVLPRQLSDWSFVDVGAGRGRALLVAAQQGYRRIIGVELAKELCDEAAANIAALPADLTKADRVQILHANAVSYRLPVGANVVYFSAPFGRISTVAFVESLGRQYEQARRPIVVFYYYSMFADVFDTCPHLHRLRLPLWLRAKFAVLSPHPIAIYTTSEALPLLRLKPTIAD